METTLLQALSLLDGHHLHRTIPSSRRRRRKHEHIPKSGIDNSKDFADESRCDGMTTYGRNCTRNTYTRIHHSYQLEPWDCGLASLVMIARWLRLEVGTNEEDEEEDRLSLNAVAGSMRSHTSALSSTLSQAEMEERQQVLTSMGTTSIWTADLVWELHKWKEERRTCRSSSSSPSVSCGSSLHPFLYAFVTKNLGVDDDYREVEYYHHAFEEDERRITRKFQDLAAWGSPMILSSLSTSSPPAGTTLTSSFAAMELGPVNVNTTARTVNTNNELSLSLVASILEHNEDCVAITLLDNHILCKSVIVDGIVGSQDDENNCPSLDGTTNQLEDGPCMTTVIKDGSSYAGHYVIICGISRNPLHLKEAQSWEDHVRSGANRPQQLGLRGDSGKNTKRIHSTCHREEDFCFVLSNPAPSTPAPFMFVTPHRLEASWRAKGTDEDIIFIRKCSLSDPKTKDNSSTKDLSPIHNTVISSTKDLSPLHNTVDEMIIEYEK